MAGPNDVFRFSRTDSEVRNRAIVAAMTNKQSHEDGSLSDAEIEWLRRRAEGGFGIVTTAASHVVREGQGWPQSGQSPSDSHSYPVFPKHRQRRM